MPRWSSGAAAASAPGASAGEPRQQQQQQQQSAPLCRLRNIVCVPFGPEEEFAAQLHGACALGLLPADGLAARVLVEVRFSMNFHELSWSVAASVPCIRESPEAAAEAVSAAVWRAWLHLACAAAALPLCALKPRRPSSDWSLSQPFPLFARARHQTQAESCPRAADLAACVREEHPGVSVDAHCLYGLDCSGRRTDEGRVMVEYALLSVRAADRPALAAAVRGLLTKLPAGAEGIVQGGWVD